MLQHSNSCCLLVPCLLCKSSTVLTENRLLRTPYLGVTSPRLLFSFLLPTPTMLQVCEKALADYMESKRRAFPRFYFVSTADLLDILSNGNNPVKVSSRAFEHRTLVP